MSDFKNTNKEQKVEVKKERLVIERFIKLASFDKWADIDSSEVRVWKAKKWYEFSNNYREYELSELLRSGYVVVSVTKSFASSAEGRFGMETAILEREIK